MSNGNDIENDNGSGSEPATQVLLAKELTTDGSTCQRANVRVSLVFSEQGLVITDILHWH
jgi:hypothetical protein